eukprot:TRINITY_DN64662_c0_g1_i2.p1 TRINITY_DN64662_c0_g1~~TRINITY_DN64662_c0_g1_i2.p1  ORF type:complete len:327 (-),score=159.99 TRINITY_DN64662_c0_g1_i2:8-988(-)
MSYHDDHDDDLADALNDLKLDDDNQQVTVTIKPVLHIGIDKEININTKVEAPKYIKPRLGSSFHGVAGQERNTELPSMAKLKEALWADAAAKDKLADVFADDTACRIVCRRRALKELWAWDRNQDDYYKKNFRATLIASLSGGVLCIDTERQEFGDKTSAIGAGTKFKTMCMSGGSGTSVFSLVHMTKRGDGEPVEVLSIGTVDCEDVDGKQVALKLMSSHPKYFNIFRTDQTASRIWLYRMAYLAGVDRVVRGHRDKRKEKLDKLEEVATERLLFDDERAGFQDVLFRRLRAICQTAIALAKIDPDAELKITFDDTTNDISMELL